MSPKMVSRILSRILGAELKDGMGDVPDIGARQLTDPS